MAVNSNKARTKGQKNPSLEEIEQEQEVPEVIPEISTFKLEDVITKSPDEITAEEQDFLADNADDLTDEQKVSFGLMDKEDLGDEQEQEEEVPEQDKKKVIPEKKEELEESQEEKDRKYKAQQAEAEIQFERNKAINNKVEEAKNLPDPTPEELKTFVAQDGVTWDELTTFEQAQAKRSFIAERKLSLVTEAVQEGKKVDDWAKKVDDFIDSTDGKQEFIELSGSELEFRKYCMKESHRGTPIDVLLPAFLHQLPPKKTNRGSLFLKGGGGEKQVNKDGIMDADQAAKLRTSNPREYQKQVKAGKIKIEI